MREDVVDGVDKAHVEHLVGLVENHGVYVVEVYHAAVYQVDEASRRGHDNLDALAEGANLALYRRAAVDGQHLKAGSVFGHIGQVAGNLQAQLARGSQYQCLRHTPFQVDALDDGQAEGRCLARARLRQRHDVAVAPEQQGYNLFLHRHRCLKSHLGNGAQQVVAHAQFFKSHVSYVSKFCLYRFC